MELGKVLPASATRALMEVRDESLEASVLGNERHVHTPKSCS
jgi:hypothetical protein